MSHAQNDDDVLDDDGQQQQDEQEAATTTTGTASKKKRIVRVVKTAPPKPAPKKSISTVRNNNDDDDDAGQEAGGNEHNSNSNTNQTSGEGKAKKPKVVVVVKRPARPQLSEFEQAAAAIAAAAPSAASIITANAVAAVEAREKEPKLQCSECQQQLPKSDFSSSQAKKMVGRKCKQCVVKVAELEARMAEEAAQYEAKMALERELQRISQAMSELENNSEPAERQRIVDTADSEIAAFSRDFASVLPANERDLHELRLCAIAFFLSVSQEDIEARPEPQGRWIFSCRTDPKKYKDYHKARAMIPRSFIPDEMWCTPASSARLLANPAHTLQTMIGMWSDTEAIPVATRHCDDAGQPGWEYGMLWNTAHVIHDLYVAGAGRNLPKELSGFQLATKILTVDFKRLEVVSRDEWIKSTIHSGLTRHPHMVGIATKLAQVTLAVLRDMPPDATATQEEVLRFMVALMHSGIGLATGTRYAFDVPHLSSCDEVCALFRFLFVSDDVNPRYIQQQSPAANQRPCFISRVLGRSDNSLPENVGALMFVFLAQMATASNRAIDCVRYLALVADVLAQPHFIDHITVGRTSAKLVPYLREAVSKCNKYSTWTAPSLTKQLMSMMVRHCLWAVVGHEDRRKSSAHIADMVIKHGTRIVANVLLHLNQVADGSSKSATEVFVTEVSNRIAVWCGGPGSWEQVEKPMLMRAGRAGGLSDEKLEDLLKLAPPTPMPQTQTDEEMDRVFKEVGAFIGKNK